MRFFRPSNLLNARFETVQLGLLVGALGLGLLAGINAWGPLESSEARYAEIGREMLVSGDWLHPRLLGIQHFHKPPLTYWLTAAGLAVAGPTAAGVRLLPALAVLLQVVLVYGLGRLFFHGNRALALVAAVVYGTLPVVLISALNVTTDAYLATFELAASVGSTLCVLLLAKTVLHQNELRFGGTRPLAARLQRPDLAGRRVVAYNVLLPSLAFGLGQIPLSLYDGNGDLRRETQFEHDATWRQLLVHLQGGPPPAFPLTASTLLLPVLVARGPLLPERQWLRIGLPREEQIGRWRIYY